GGGGGDALSGYDGRDLLIGGTGGDNLQGGRGEDLLIAGSTAFDADIASLMAIADAWNGPAAYAQRIADLRSGVGEASAVHLEAGVTVFNDTSRDVLSGGADADWYVAN